PRQVQDCGRFSEPRRQRRSVHAYRGAAARTPAHQQGMAGDCAFAWKGRADWRIIGNDKLQQQWASEFDANSVNTHLLGLVNPSESGVTSCDFQKRPCGIKRKARARVTRSTGNYTATVQETRRAATDCSQVIRRGEGRSEDARYELQRSYDIR